MDGAVDLPAVLTDARQRGKLGQASAACKALEEYTEFGWGDSRFVSLLGVACCFAGNPADGVPALERALELAPGPPAHFNLGQAYQMLGDLDQARECYKRAISLDPTYTQALNALRVLKGQAAEAQGQEAQQSAYRVSSADGPHLDANAHLLTDPD